MIARLALLVVTAVWGVTFVQVKDAVALYPLTAFLGVRFALASAVLALPAAPRLRRLGREGFAAGAVVGALLAAGFALQTAGLERTTVSSTGFITGLYVVLTPLFGLAIFRTPVGPAVWGAVALAVAGLALLSGIHAGSPAGDLLVLASAAAQALQIVAVGRIAARYDALALTLVQVATAAVAFLAAAVALGDLSWPRGWTVWGALVVTALFASVFALLVQIWTQRRIGATQIALIFSLETVFAGLFGYVLDGDRLGVAGWAGCGLILGGIVLAEPASAAALRRMVGARRAS